MRHAFTFLAVFTAFTASAQVDQSTPPGMPEMTVEDDNDPFVPNAFIGGFRLEMHLFENGVEKEHSPVNMRYWSTEDKTVNQMQQPTGAPGSMKIVTDLRNKWTYMLMTDEQGNRTAMKTHKKKVVMKDAKAETNTTPEITVTKETMVIDGHTCTKVISKTDAGTWTGWVAQDMSTPFEDLMRSMAGVGDKLMQGARGVHGFPLQYEWADANGKDKMVGYVKEIVVGTVDPAVYSLDGYTVMEMPGTTK